MQLVHRDRELHLVADSDLSVRRQERHDLVALSLRVNELLVAEVLDDVDLGREAHRAGLLAVGELDVLGPEADQHVRSVRSRLGRAIVREPSVFLMDEPLSNLDAKLRVQTRAEIARLHQRLGTTTVYVTHDQVEAMTMGDRIAVMKDGLLQQVGSPQDLYDHPVNIFVAGFIGSPSMNFATAKAEGKDLMLGSAKLELSGEPARAAETRPDGADVLIGFRPEHIELANGQETSAVRFPAKVDVVEYLGNEELIHAQAEGNEIVALLPSDRKVGVGDEVQLAVPMDKLHIFDPESEKTLAG